MTSMSQQNAVLATPTQYFCVVQLGDFCFAIVLHPVLRILFTVCLYLQ